MGAVKTSYWVGGCRTNELGSTPTPLLPLQGPLTSHLPQDLTLQLNFVTLESEAGTVSEVLSLSDYYHWPGSIPELPGCP
eukprot:759529-Hanusia_phi.AAC.7